jgi:hypothetical protein
LPKKAEEIGIRLIKAKLRVAAMAGELDWYRDSQWNHIPWRSHVDEALEQILLPAATERIEGLQLALDAANPAEMLRTLHTFLKENL